MQKKLEESVQQISQNREEIIDKLIQFSATDLLLFWGTNADLAKRQELLWSPVLKWVGQTLANEYKITHSLDVPGQDEKAGDKLRQFMESLDDKQLAALFAAALLMRSVLLACALVKGKISAKEAYNAALVEELWQAEHWGVDEEAQSRRDDILKELSAIEAFLKN